MALIVLDENWFEKSTFLTLFGTEEGSRPFSCARDVLASVAGDEQKEWLRRALEHESGPPVRDNFLTLSVNGEAFDFRVQFVPGRQGPMLLLERPDQIALSREELDEYERIRTFFQLFKGIIHDVKSKLHFILNNYDYLEDIMPDMENEFTRALQEILDDNREGLQIAYDLMRDTLNYGVYGSDAKGPMDFPSILSKSLSFLGGDLRGISLETNFGESTGTVVGTAEKMERVFVTLLLNSVQAFPSEAGREKRISIRGTAEGETYIILFADNGPGMEEDVREKLFKDRVSTKAPEGGTGLGLLFVRDIVEKELGGRISVSSEKGAGAVFRLEFPLSEGGVE